MKLLEPSDVERIRAAIRAWGKPAVVASRYDERTLMSQIDIWRRVTEMNWDAREKPKYEQDIVIRYWIQVVLEAVNLTTRERLQRLVIPIDARFQEKMRPQAPTSYGKRPSLRERSYFWETHTLLPE
jgi:hypothetical protein